MKRLCRASCCYRYDVLLTANASVGNYWISAQPQYREGSPSGFAVLQYVGAAEGSGLPQTATPQPGSVQPWTPLQAATVSSTCLCSKRRGGREGGQWGVMKAQGHGSCCGYNLYSFKLACRSVSSGSSSMDVSSCMHVWQQMCWQSGSQHAAMPTHQTTHDDDKFPLLLAAAHWRLVSCCWVTFYLQWSSTFQVKL